MRGRLIWDSFQEGTGTGYKYPKRNGNVLGLNPVDYTSFLIHNRRFGEDRDHRAPELFILHPTHIVRKPTNYVMDHGSVILDAFDYGIRDFGTSMPLCLSSQLEGHDIETYPEAK